MEIIPPLHPEITVDLRGCDGDYDAACLRGYLASQSLPGDKARVVCDQLDKSMLPPSGESQYDTAVRVLSGWFTVVE